MTAFYEVNAEMFAVTIDETSAVLSEDQVIQSAFIPIEGSIEKIEYASSIAQRIVEWRDNVVQYNNDLVRFRYFDDNVWTGFYYPSVPDSLKYITVE